MYRTVEQIRANPGKFIGRHGSDAIAGTSFSHASLAALRGEDVAEVAVGRRAAQAAELCDARLGLGGDAELVGGLALDAVRRTERGAGLPARIEAADALERLLGASRRVVVAGKLLGRDRPGPPT